MLSLKKPNNGSLLAQLSHRAQSLRLELLVDEEELENAREERRLPCFARFRNRDAVLLPSCARHRCVVYHEEGNRHITHLRQRLIRKLSIYDLF